MSEFEPEIVAFACHYCAYSAADNAGSQRLQYPTNVKVVKIPCTGKIDVLHVLRAFEEGVDGAFVAGWLEGTCHYLEGNLRARRRVEYTQKILDQVGVGGNRLEMVNMSSAMGRKWAEVCTEMTARIKELGPSPVRRTETARSSES